MQASSIESILWYLRGHAGLVNQVYLVLNNTHNDFTNFRFHLYEREGEERRKIGMCARVHGGGGGGRSTSVIGCIGEIVCMWVHGERGTACVREMNVLK